MAAAMAGKCKCYDNKRGESAPSESVNVISPIMGKKKQKLCSNTSKVAHIFCHICLRYVLHATCGMPVVCHHAQKVYCLTDSANVFIARHVCF